MTSPERPMPAPAPAAAADSNAHRLQPGGRRMVGAATWLLVVVVAAALAVGAPALAWAGRLAGLTGVMAWLMTVVVDGTMVVLSLAAVARRGLGERAGWMWMVTGGLVVASAWVQASHALAVTAASSPQTRGLAAAAGAVAPLVVFVGTHAWLDLAVGAAPSGKRRAAAPGRTPRTATAPAAQPTSASTVPSGSDAASDMPASPVPGRRATAPAGTVEQRVAHLRAQAQPLRAEGLSYEQIAQRLGATKGRVMRALNSGNTADRVGAAA